MNTPDQKTPEMKLLEWARTGFQDLEREDLKTAADMLGVDFAPQTNNDTLRKKLCDAIGMVEGTMSSQEVASVKRELPPPSLHANPPNLGPSGRWGGRYRRVRLVKTDYYKNFIAFPVSWEGQIKYFHFDTEVDMPWPYFIALSNMVETHIHKRLSADGRRVESSETKHHAVPFSDLGDVPGTERLPRSMVEYVRSVADAHKHFAEADRRTLVRVMRWLHGARANVMVKDMSDDEIRDSLLMFVGVDIYADAA